MTSNSSVSVTSFELSALDLFMDDTSLLVIEETLNVNATRKFRLDQDATIISGGSWPGHSGGRVNVTTSSFVLHGEIRASGGEGICIDGKCTPGGNGGFVTLLYTSVATETGSIVVSGGANPLNSDPSANAQAVDYDDVLFSANCLSGAAGQVLRIFASNKGVDGYLVISNGFNGPSSNSVRRCAPVVFNTDSIDPSVKRVLIEGESLVRFEGATWGMHGDSELIVEDATLVGVAATPLHIFVKQLVVRGTSVLHSSAGLFVTADILSIDYGAKVTWSPQASSKFVISDGVQINGNVTTTSHDTNGGTFIIESGGNLVVEGTVATPTLFAASNTNMILTGSIRTKAQTLVDNVEYRSCSDSLDTDPVRLNYTLMLTSQGSIDLGQPNKPSFLSGSSILLCSNQSIRVGYKSVVSATGLGYPASRGLGTGECTDGSGGGGGYGGDGGDSVEIQPGRFETVHSDGGLSYGSRSSTGFLGSGGGCVSGGSGGGLVMLGAYRVELNGSILANGQNGQSVLSGGGSGGYVGLTISNGILGTGYLSASGGNATCSQDAFRSSANATWNCGGGGGGGRLRLLGCENFSDCTTSFSGTYSVVGGKADRAKTRASIGTYFGFPCPPGYGGLMCRVCDKGTFKQERGSSECLACKNSPLNAHYTKNGSTTSECLWSCDPGYTGIHCLSPLDDFFDMFGGKFVFFIVAFVTLIVIIATGYSCKKDPYTPEKPANALEKDHLIAKRPWYKIRVSRMIWPRVSYPKLQENELKIHMARIYLSGNNTQENPLRLHPDVPRGLDLVLNKDKFKYLADCVNSILAFSTGGSLLFNVTKVLCYPMASDVMFYRRHKKFNALKRWMSKYNHECMLGARSRAMSNAIKLGYCTDYSLAYIELLYVENHPSNCIPRPPGIVGKPHLPLVLLFAGLGTYESPLYLDPNDLLVRSLPQSPELTAFIDEAWIEIIADLNAMLRVVNLKDKSHSLRELIEITKFCEQKNGHNLRSQKGPSLGGLRMQLGRFFTGGRDSYQWGLFLTCVGVQKSIKVAQSQPETTIGIREQALLENPNVWSPTKQQYSGSRTSGGWDAPVDETLPIPGILLNTEALEERQNHVLTRNQFVCNMHRILPSNVMKATSESRSWIIYITIAVSVLLDLATTLGMLVNLKCVENGTEMRSCTSGVLWPVLLVYPFAIIISPVCGIVTLTTASPTFARKYGLWNAFSVANVAVAIVICYIESDKLVAPYVTRPLPLFPCATLLFKLLQAVLVDFYIADIESTRRRRGWRGLMKRRDSDSSTPPTSPYHSPRLNEAVPFKETDSRRGSSHYGTLKA